MLIADGLFAFLSEPVIVGVFRRMTDALPAPASWRSTTTATSAGSAVLAVKLAPQKMFASVGSQWGYPGFEDARVPETWNPRITLVEEASLTHAPEIDLFPNWIRVATS